MSLNQDLIAQLYIELADTSPCVWRRVHVPIDFRLRRVHDVIQAVFDWRYAHLHQFEVGDKVYGLREIVGDDPFGPKLSSDKNIKLQGLLERDVNEFVYRYDLGDDWEHRIVVEQVFEPQEGVEYPILVAGERQAPPEDVGGPPGFAEFLEAVEDENHPDHDELKDWLGGEGFDPNDMQLEAVEAMLRSIRASRRKGPKKGTRMPSNKVWRKP